MIKYYFVIKNDQIIGKANLPVIDEDVLNTETTEMIFNDYEQDKYIYSDGNIILNPKWEELKAQKERERLDKLSMTRGDVFEALILAKGLTKPQIRAMIEQVKLDDITKALYLNRFDEALDFYRGFPVFDMLGQALGITGEMLDKFFDTKNYHYLTTCNLTINPTPADATVAVEPNPTPYGEVAHYKVECEGYLTIEGDIEMLQDTTLDVELVAIEGGGDKDADTETINEGENGNA